MGVRTNGQMGSADSPGKMDEKLKSENVQKKRSFFIRIYLRMHYFVVKFSKLIRLRRQGGVDPLTKILRVPLHVALNIL